MANRIKPLRRTGSTGLPNVANMQEGEIAVNSYDQKIWMRVGSNLVEIANAGGSAAWGSITGTLSNQTDLQDALDSKANDNEVVKTTGNQSILGIKRFIAIPWVNSYDGTGSIRFGAGFDHIQYESGAFYIGGSATTNSFAKIDATGIYSQYMEAPLFKADWYYGGSIGPSSEHLSNNFQIYASGGTISLRPRGANDVANETTIASNGNMSVGGNISASGSVSDSSGNLRSAINQKADASSVVTTSGNQSNLSGNKTWTGDHYFSTVTVNTGGGTVGVVLDSNDGHIGGLSGIGSSTVSLHGEGNLIHISPNGRNATPRSSFYPDGSVTLGGDTTVSGSVAASGITSPSLTGTSSITTISAGSTSGVIRFRPRGATQTTGQMELHNSGTLTSRNGYYYSYSGEIRLGSASNYIYMNSNGAVFTPGRVSAEVDNTYPCGGSGYRWTVVYATTGSINTSDAREKQDFRELTEQELRCGLQLARDAQIYKWKHAVEEKGEGARLHCSPTVQQVIATMESFGLDPFRYGFVCYDEWDAEPDKVDEEGQVEKKGSPAGNRYSLRPDELRAFVDAAVVARQDLIEARLEALEAHE